MSNSQTYVRKTECSPWHFASNCSNLPHAWAEITESAERPTDGELCNQCLSKEGRGVALPITRGR